MPIRSEETGKENRTVFVSNLDFETTEDEVKEAFTAVGKVTDIRLVRDFKGRSKGFCYVELQTEDEALDALKKDREALKGRPMFVSRCDPDKHTRQKVFKYNMGMEKNKLFVRGLPMSMSQEQVRELFATYGALRDVRLVTYRNGHSKGLAYIDFEDETEAAQALIKTDSLELEGHTISVAISRPPERKMAQASLLTPEVPSLGGRSNLIGTNRGSRGPSLMPRSVRLALPSEPASASSNGATVAESSSAQTSKAPARSNQDFRNMLLGNK
ncbi:hypothetical protein B566_EDAN003042 [Ephemera danica]|nr:hypothetical protein B566_EDAN003042 [Ephemera danica]